MLKRLVSDYDSPKHISFIITKGHQGHLAHFLFVHTAVTQTMNNIFAIISAKKYVK